jgi:protein-disulfide isomerase
MRAGVLAAVSVATLVLACDRGSDGHREVPSASIAKPASSVPEIPGVDLSSLAPSEKTEYATLVRTLAAPCPDLKNSIAECAIEAGACKKKCESAARYVARSVHAEKTRDQIERGLKKRFDPTQAAMIAIDGSPARGPENAPVTIVAFVDYTNGACQKLLPVLEKAQRDYEKFVRLAFKFRPKDPGKSEDSARRALAAGAQNKFWEMSDKLLDNPYEIELVTKYVKDLALDEKKFVHDLTSDAISDRLFKDKRTAENLGVTAIPMTFVNGHEYDPLEDIAEWIEREIP